MKCFLVLILLLTAGAGLCAQVPDDYRPIDRHALRAPAALSTDLPALAAYLAGPAKTDTERARSFYTWIVHNIRYDEQAAIRDTVSPPGGVDRVLARQAGICHDFSRLFRAMCREANLTCVVIEGYSRAMLTDTLLPAEPNHAWNAVFLDGQWRLLDATWGAGTLQGPDQWTASYGKSYFLPPPGLFVLNHLPAVPAWQLLDCPVQTEQWRQPVGAGLFPADTCAAPYAWRDSIDYFLALDRPAQRLWAAHQTWGFHSTPANRNALGQAWLDEASRLSDEAEALSHSADLAALQRLNEHILSIFHRADSLTILENWQRELWATTLINQAVAHYQLVSQTSGEPPYPKMLLLLEQADRLLATLPDNFITAQNREQCQAYLQFVSKAMKNK